MTTRTYITKSGDQYEWEETTEVLASLKVLHEQQQVPADGSNNSLVQL
ncbi:hypothetical protein MUO66_06115 [Candidatus Bathyarchaeota archaeon]|nr:hypothetical protein [Candidatus Bathyarchaeota archaeon]